MIEIVQRSLFDIAESIRTRLKNTAEDIIAIGNDLLEAKASLHHGQYENWLRTEFDMSLWTANKFVQVAKRFKSVKFTDLPVSVLYALAAPSTPDEVIEMVQTGQIPATLSAIREAKQETVDYDRSQVGYKWEDGRFKLQEAYTPPDATSLLLQGTQVAKEAYEAAIEDRPFIIAEEPRRNIDNIPIAVPHISSKNNEWYTPQKYIDAARELMGDIDIDPASNPTANEIVKAARYYTITDNGLDKDWTGRVWLNPPYGRDEAGSNQDIWSRRLIEQYNAGITTEAVLLVNAAVDTKWFQRLFDYPVCFPDHRINFYTPEPTVSGSTHGSSLVYFGDNPVRFYEIFKEFGTVVRRWS